MRALLVDAPTPSAVRTSVAIIGIDPANLLGMIISRPLLVTGRPVYFDCDASQLWAVPRVSTRRKRLLLLLSLGLAGHGPPSLRNDYRRSRCLSHAHFLRLGGDGPKHHCEYQVGNYAQAHGLSLQHTNGKPAAMFRRGLARSTDGLSAQCYAG